MVRACAIALCLVIELLGACAGPADARPPRPPNVVLVTIDTLRADHLGSYGYPRATSPNLDRLARSGVRFRTAVAQGSWTYTALPALVTSRFPQDGADFWTVREGTPWAAGRLPRNATTMAQLFRGRGYRTALVSGHAGLGRIVGLRGGLDSADIGDYRAGSVTDRAVEMLPELETQPFFLWLHYIDPHGPYAPPAPWDRRFVADGKLVTGRTVRVGDRPNLPSGGMATNDLLDGHRDLDFYVARYDGEIAYADEQIGRLLAALRASELERDTIVIVTADHGEMLGEHDLYGHLSSLYAPILQIPLIVSWPGHLRARVVRGPVMAVDLLPTVAALVGAPPDPAWAGQSLAECTRTGRCRDRDAFATRGVEIAVQTSEWKMVCSADGQRCRLHDVLRDPGEWHDVASARPRVAAALRDHLLAWSRAHPDPGGSRPLGILPEPDAETRAALRALGYVQ